MTRDAGGPLHELVVGVAWFAVSLIVTALAMLVLLDLAGVFTRAT